MVQWEHDVLDERFPAESMDKFFRYFTDVEITTADDVYEGSTCCYLTRHEIYGVTLTNGTEIEIPSADVRCCPLFKFDLVFGLILM